MSQIEFAEPNEEPTTGRVRSRLFHQPAVSYIKLMYLVNLLFVAGWTVLTCLLVIEPEAQRIPLPNWLIWALSVTGYAAAMSAIFALKFGKLWLLVLSRNFFRAVCIAIIVAVVLGLHYVSFRKDFLLLVLGFLYLYQSFLTNIKKRWPDIEEQRWTEYLDPISKFRNQQHYHDEQPLTIV